MDYSIFSKELQKKIQYSIELLKKAEHLAKAYDNENGYYLAFSGGKDSQALYHIAKLAGVQFKAHMNLTSIDPPEVIRFIKKQYPDVVLHAPKESIYRVALRKGILPTMRVRWCCEEFKEMAGAGKVTLIGIRHEESSRRAKRNEVEVSGKAFSGTLDELDKFRENRKKNKSSINITNANGERTLGCIRGKETLLISPIIAWTEKDIWEFLNKLGIEHCELYDKGHKRIGCICCPMNSSKKRIEELKLYPHVKRNWIKTIVDIRRRGGNTKKNISLCRFQDIERKVSACSSSDRLTEEQEYKIAEYIFEWWVSGKSYTQWYAEKFQQTKLDI